MSEGAGVRDGAGRPRRLVDLIGAFLWSPLDGATWRANLAILLGLLIAMLSIGTLSACFSAGGSMLIWLIGIPIIGLGIEFSRLFARVERWRMTLVDRRPLLPHPYRPFDGPPRRPFGPWVRAWAETEFLDANRWRDVVYSLVLAPLAALEFAVAVGLWAAAIGLIAAPLVLAGLRSIGVGPLLEDVPVAWDTAVVVAMIIGLALVPVAASVSRGLMLMHRAVVEGLLCVSPSAALRQEVERLRGSRSAAVELEASELRRIERDLHDGAQQRLVMLTIDLGLAAERLDRDPASARVLVVEAQDQARQALAELRDLVRGIAPAILLDRGLVAALGAIAGRCPVPTIVQSTLPAGTRLPDAMERTAYFVVAEALANVAKHASAGRCEIRCRAEERGLVVEVWDNGAGGARILPTGGLSGLAGRVEALDGSLEVESPPGGPTLVRAVIPPAAYVPR
ncbi:MAG: sensor domain-containing protein [Candidatus Limnocylindrales bacterium]|nr:sensor domain-containing protein [Candidatus Limnocylindrales bacterium]